MIVEAVPERFAEAARLRALEVDHYERLLEEAKQELTAAKQELLVRTIICVRV
jgi:hypothetical protein